MLITLDGMCGVGKTTQLRRLAERIPTLNKYAIRTNVRHPVKYRDDFLKQLATSDLVTDGYVGYFKYSHKPKNIPSQFDALGLPFNAPGCFHFVLQVESPQTLIDRLIQREGKSSIDVNKLVKTFKYMRTYYDELVEMSLMTRINADQPIDTITNEIVSITKEGVHT